MKEPRPEAETSGDAPAVANQNADVLERDLMALIAFDISEQRAIVARLNAPKMRRQNFHEGLGRRQCLAVLAIGEERNTGLFEQRRFRRQLPGPLVRGGELARLVLAGLDIRLIEWIDAEDRTGNGRGKLPTEEFLANVVAIGDGDAHDRVTRTFERVDRI